MFWTTPTGSLTEKLVMAQNRAHYVHALAEAKLWPKDVEFRSVYCTSLYYLNKVLEKVGSLAEIHTKSIGCSDCYLSGSKKCEVDHITDWTMPLKKACQDVRNRLAPDGISMSTYLCLDCLKTDKKLALKGKCRIGMHTQWNDVVDRVGGAF